MNKYNYTIRFHLGRGEYFGFYQIRTFGTNSSQGKEIIEYINPELFSIEFSNCLLHNKVKESTKIYNGANKKPCSWLCCQSYKVVEIQNVEDKEQVKFNPRKSANWHTNNKSNIDGLTVKTVITNSNKLYI